MRYLVGLALSIVSLIGAATDCLAEPQSVLITKELLLRFAPESVYLFIDSPRGEVRRIAGAAAPVPTEGEARSGLQRWLVGGAVNALEVGEPLTVSVLVLGLGNNVSVVPPFRFEPGEEAFKLSDSEAIRARLYSTKATITQMRTEIEVQAASVSRLKRDADELANVKKILEIRDEALLARDYAAGVQRDIDRLTAAVKFVKLLPLPKSYARREVELTQQLAELTEAATHAERSERERRVASEGQLQTRMQLLERTRGISLEALQEEREALRQKRAELEGQL